MIRLSGLALSASVFAAAAVSAQQAPIDLDRVIGGNKVADLYIYPHFQDDYELGEALPERLKALTLAPGFVVDVEELRAQTRLDKLRRYSLLDKFKDRVDADVDYHDRLFDLGDRLIFDRSLTITYDPAICANAEGGLDRILQSTVCFQQDQTATPKQTASIAQSIRKTLATTPKDYELPGGIAREAALKLSDDDLVGAFLNTGEYTISVYSELPTTAFVDPTANVDQMIKEVQSVDGGVRPTDIETSATDLSRRLIFNSPQPPFASTSPKDRSNLPFNPTEPEKIAPTDEGLEKIQRERWRQIMKGGYDVLARRGVDATRAPEALLKEFGIKRDLTLNPTPEQERKLRRLFADALPDTMTAPGTVENGDLNFLTGFTYGRKYSGVIGHTFYKGDRFFDPVFVRLNYWFEPILTLKAPFHGEVTSAEWTFKKFVQNSGQVLYYPSMIQAKIDLQGQNVDPAGNDVFNAVGLPHELRADGYEFKIGLTADATLTYDIPGPDQKKVYFDEIGYALKGNFAPALGPGRVKMSELNAPWERTGLGVDIGIAEAGVDFGVALFGADAALTVDHELPGGYQANRPQFNGQEYVMRMRQDMQRSLSVVDLYLDNPRYDFAMDYTPFVRPDLKFGVGRYSWRYNDPIYIDMLTIRDRRTLTGHAGVNNRNRVSFPLPEIPEQ